MRARVEKSSEIHRTPRVVQVEGLFDVPLEEKLRLSLDVPVPVEGRPWNIGLIVGPSGSGKSSVREALWGQDMTFEWHADRALVDEFPADMKAGQVTELLSAVGLGTVPAWLRPYATLSNGEAFRASMARLLAETADGAVAVVDEFTSVVDRQVAKVASHAVAKTVRRAQRQLVAVSCHFDIIDWLQPDWVLEMPVGDFTWRSVHRHPDLRMEIFAVNRSAWALFGKFHYLSPYLHPAAKCFCAYVDGRPVAFTSYLNFPHPRTKNIRMAHRVVVLPDWQGLGISGRLADWCGQYLYDQHLRYRFTIAHPAMIATFVRSPRWRETRKSVTHIGTGMKETGLRGGMRERQLQVRTLGTRSFEYIPPKEPPKET